MMRILVANKFWYRRGGLENVMFDEIEMLEAAGHVVAHFSTAHPENVRSPWERYFAPYLEIGGAERVRGARAGLAAVRMLHNRPAARAFAALLREFRPDVIHCHGIHRQISPSILGVAIAAGVPVVQTLHDYHHVCPADVLLRGGVSPCDPPRCSRGSYLPAVRNRCVRGSLAASALSAAETWFQRSLDRYESAVSAFVSPSEFLSDVVRRDGWRVPIHVVPNAVDAPAPVELPRAGYAYAGRLSPEKGVGVLLEAARIAGVHVTVAGDGPLRRSLETAYPEATFLGHLPPDGVRELLARSTAAVLPSSALENAPLGVLEAMAAGTAVVATRVGGVPEIVRDGEEGLLVPPNDVPALAEALRTLERDSGLAASMGRRGRGRIVAEYSREAHLERLVRVYESVLDGKRDT